ncbi:MAG: DNA internalization-related competence protein ComEC/Rec2 [Deltaproteobacteria bacterium]|nr:DNA internalization-related competence protein ComEC/Rec2 [Deltaproteobacteria bacterium]
MLGIWAGQLWPASRADLAVISIGLSGVAALLSIRGLGRSATLAVLAALVVLGVMAGVRTFHPVLSPEHVTGYMTGERQVLEGRLVSPPHVTPTGVSLIIEAEQIGTEDRLVPCLGKVRLRIKDPRGSLPRFGDRVRAWVRLKAPVDYGNPGGFEYIRSLSAQGIHCTGFLPDTSRLVVTASGHGPTWRLAIERIRDSVRKMLERSVKGADYSVLRALVIGESGTIPTQLRDTYARAGAAHLLAISGLHLSGLAWMAYRAALFLLLRFEWVILRLDVRAAAAGVTIFPVLIYTLLAGARVPTQRAAVMVIAYLLSIILRREKDMYSTLALAALAILMLQPGSLFEVSFQLSFTAVLAIIYLGPKLMEMFRKDSPLEPPGPHSGWRRFKEGLFYAAAASVAAWLGIAPLLAWHFHRISLIAPAANLLLIPLVMFFILPMALVGILVGFGWPLAAHAGLTAAGFGTHILNRAAEVFASAPGSFFWATTPAIWEMILWYTALAAGVHWKKRSARWAVLILVAALGLGNGVSALAARWSSELRVTFLNVGKGDATMIELPGGSAALVDGGGFYDRSYDIGRFVVAPALWQKGIRRLEWVAATHGHPDHVNGLFFILEAFRPRELWVPEGGTLVPLMEKLIRAARGRGVKVKEVSRETPVVTMNGVHIRVLNPPWQAFAELSPVDHRRINDNSMVLSLEYQGFRFLLAADVEQEGEQALLVHPRELRANVLKVPHHGGATSSSPEFVAAVGPQYAVFSSDGRRLPSLKVVNRYRQADARILRTDQLGAVEFVVRNGRPKLRTYRRQSDAVE